MEDVIKEMLNDESKDMRFKKIFIDDIDPSPFNIYPMQDIEALASNIAECGLLHPITLYKKENNRYMILSGERRYRAMHHNYINGDDRWEEIPAIIKSLELNDREIKRFIRRGNANRENLSKEIKLEIVKESLDDYLTEKAEGNISPGILKRDWISMDTGFSSRSVQDYLNNIDKTADKKVKVKHRYKEIETSISNILDTPVKITEKQIAIKVKDKKVLQQILKALTGEDYTESLNESMAITNE